MSLILKLKLNKIRNIYYALMSFDGQDVILKSKPEEQEKVVKQPFKFSGNVRWNLTKNLRVLLPHVEDYDKLRNEIVKDISGGRGMVDQNDPIQVSGYLKQVDALDNQEVEITGLLKIKSKDLNLDENAIPMASLMILELLIEES